MVFIVAASSADHALETLTPETREKYQDNIFSKPGLSLNVNTKNPKKIFQNLLSKDLSEKRDIIISKHESNDFRPLTVPQLLEILEGID